MSDTPHAPEHSDEPGTEAQVKQAATDIVAGAAVSAAKGAAVGGAAGAAAGAVKGAVASGVRNPFVRKVLAGVIAGAVIVAIVVAAAAMNMAFTMLTSVLGSADQNTEYAIADDGVSADIVSTANEASSRYSIPRELVIAVLLSNSEYDFTRVADHLAEQDPSKQLRDLRTGATSSSSQMAMTIAEDGPQAVAAQRVHDLYVSALTVGGFSKPQSESIYQTALHWALGNTVDPEESACLVPATADSEQSAMINGTSWTAGQIANMKVVIGLAKTMFPGDVRAAATVGLITVRQESSFRNYANDGVFNRATDPNPGPFDADDYAELTYSLELPHDAVGSDHSSLGLMQQQATMGWGDYGTSTWAGGDYREVIGRLMNPSYTIGKFFAKLDGISGWQEMEPGAVAQRIQVSAHPAAYRKHVALANEIWRMFSREAPALAVPESTGWTGTTFDDGPSTGPSCAGSPILIDGEFAWPVEMREDATPAGYITSRFGYRMLNGVLNYHSGLDLTGNGYDSAIYALTAGTVVRSNLWSPACGEYIQIAHPDGTATGYLHLTQRMVQAGETVTAGQLIGTMGGGQAGNCTFGAHLHLYTFDQHGNRVDPEPFLAARGLVFPPERIIATN